MAQQLKGAKKYFIQNFQPAEKLVNAQFSQQKAFTKKQLQEITKDFGEFFEIFKIR